MTLLVDGRLSADIELYGKEVELIVLPAVNARGVQPTDFSQAATLIADALAATRKTLAAPGRRDIRRAA